MSVRQVIPILLAVIASGIYGGQQPQTDPMQLLVEVRRKIAESTSRMPRYLCTETVERRKSQLGSDAKWDKLCSETIAAIAGHSKRLQLLSADRLRLDVAVIDKNEIYSWVGEGRFGDQSLSQLVKIGLTANGSFGSFLTAIFESPATTFSYKGESPANGRRVLEYEFRVGALDSSYHLSNARISQTVPYSGSFTVDRETLDLLKLEIHADDIPGAMNYCGVSNEMDYTKLRMNDLDFMLPSEATTQVIRVDGGMAENRTVFSGCHQFLGESKLLFDDAPAASSTVATTERRPTEIPAGLTFDIGLTEKIDPATMAAGDPIKGALVNAIQIPGGITIPQGTVLDGRISLLEMDYSDWGALEFSVKWESLEWDGSLQPLRLLLEAVVPGTAKTPDVNIKRVRANDSGGRIDPAIGHFQFLAVKKNYQIPVGFRSRWRTLGTAK
jgi:hypothetical protein